MHRSFSHRMIYFCVLVTFILNSALVMAQAYRATPLTHPDGSFSAVAINNNGQIAGTVTDTNFVSHALRREADGQFTPLTELSSNISNAYGMNELGHVLGSSMDEFFVFQPVVWEDAGLRILDLIENTVSVFPADINNAGVATGRFLDTNFVSHAVVWDAEGAVKRLPELDGYTSEAVAINEAGEIVGWIFLESEWSRAILWQPDDTGYVAKDLGTLGGEGAFATDINNHSQIVGYSFLETGFNVHAFFWEKDEMTDLGTVGGDNSRANSINDDGFIVGASQEGASGMGKPSGFGDLPGYLEVGGEWSPFETDEDFDEAMQTSLTQGTLGSNAMTSEWFFIESNERRYTFPGAGPGFPGRPYTPYGTSSEAISDNTFDVEKMTVFFPRDAIDAGFTLPLDLKVTIDSYSNSPLAHSLPESNVTYENIEVPEGSELIFSGIGIGAVEAEEFYFRDKVTAGNTNFTINSSLRVDDTGLFSANEVETGPNATVDFQPRFGFELQLRNNNPGFESDMVNRNFADQGVVTGGGGVIGEHTRHVSQATGSNGAYSFHPFSPDGSSSFVNIILEDAPSQAVNVTFEALLREGIAPLITDQILIGDWKFGNDEYRWSFEIGARFNGKRSIPEQSFTSTIRVAVDSIDLAEDPNRYRLLLFDYDGEFISEAGTFVLHDGSPPTTAVYTGFIDSMLNVSHTNVTITDSVILVLASGDVETGLDSEDETGAIKSFELAQNFPNPFNPETTIQYQLPHTSRVKLVVYDILGRPVRTLVDRDQSTGRYRQGWDMFNDTGHMVSSGVYMYRLEARSDNGERYVHTRKMVVLQ